MQGIRLASGWENSPSDRVVDEPLKHCRACKGVQAKLLETFSFWILARGTIPANPKPSLGVVIRLTCQVNVAGKLTSWQAPSGGRTVSRLNNCFPQVYHEDVRQRILGASLEPL